MLSPMPRSSLPKSLRPSPWVPFAACIHRCRWHCITDSNANASSLFAGADWARSQDSGSPRESPHWVHPKLSIGIPQRQGRGLWARDRLHWMAEQVCAVPQHAAPWGAGENAQAPSWRDHHLCWLLWSCYGGFHFPSTIWWVQVYMFLFNFCYEFGRKLF